MNMSYCRFQNTANDLADCLDNWHDDLSEEEAAAKKRLIKTCRMILEEVEHDGDEVEEDEE
jgi:hypothetical protein